MERPLGMILARRGCPEGRHDCVADELLDRAAGLRDLLGHRVVEAVQECARALGVLSAGKRGGADEIGEQHGCELPLLVEHR